ncbi:hypothetical protein KOW79_008025 [Hemibagrus wyckioides]|uniref:MADF domain-containing protein n=1 Tax=Hemibagrus wyckioides TaxID=337641 RepID=A0A9D3NT43_9TELE|nr:hypothetical protein KOW79_008025 [Hemibagrus wyckioides]
MYHNRVEKEKRWKEVANALQQLVEDVKTVSLRTQYCRLLKPKPSGSGNKPLTPRQKWPLRVMDFIKSYIVQRQCETTLGESLSEQGDTEDQDLSESRPDTPSAASTSCSVSSHYYSNEGEPTAVKEIASTASTGSSFLAPGKRSARGYQKLI